MVPPKDGFLRHLVATSVLLVLHHEAHGQSSQSYYLGDAQYWSHHTWDDHSTHVDQLSLSLSLSHTHTHTHKFAAPSNQIQALRLIFQSFKYGYTFYSKICNGSRRSSWVHWPKQHLDHQGFMIFKTRVLGAAQFHLSFTFCCFHKSPPFRKTHTQQKHVTSFLQKIQNFLRCLANWEGCLSQRLDF